MAPNLSFKNLQEVPDDVLLILTDTIGICKSSFFAHFATYLAVALTCVKAKGSVAYPCDKISYVTLRL